VDVLLFDLQDVGVRYYTYISTLKACLLVARETKTKVVVLDRPNPLGGEVVDGHLAEKYSFIACDALPTVHGLTMGEVARYLNREIGADLEVMKMEGWQRSMTWEQTGLPFLSPSPNLAEIEAVKLYPVLGQLEWCDVSVGRGTRAPFRLLGAPYIRDPQALAHHLNRSFPYPIRFQPRLFVPRTGKFEGELCGGLELTSKEPLAEPSQAGLELAMVLSRRYPERFHLRDMSRHLGREDVDNLIAHPPDPVRWLERRRPYLLYP
jgi:beta-N-acetylhexosaminidase